MLCSVLLCLPMHPGRSLVIHLHAIHPDIAFPALRILREHQRERNKTTAVLRPALQNREIKQVDLPALVDHFFAIAILHAFRKKCSQLRQFRQHLDLVENSLRRFGVQESADSPSYFIEFVHFKRHAHPLHASKRIHQQRIARTFRLFKQHCGSNAVRFAVRVARNPLRHFRNLQYRINLCAHVLQLPRLLQLLHKLPQIPIRHLASL